jgi:hypothetical protein
MLLFTLRGRPEDADSIAARHHFKGSLAILYRELRDVHRIVLLERTKEPCSGECLSAGGRMFIRRK